MSVAAAGMSSTEIRASLALASVFALRMFGLFSILPVFSIYAAQLPGVHSTALIGLAMGIYGFTQAMTLIPLGIASDRYGRKLIIVIGLLLFILGAVIAGTSNDIIGIIIGRAIQGMGAISAALSALIADSTRAEHRTKAMAMVGGGIGLTFALSLVLAPVLFGAIGMKGIFDVMAVLGVVAIGVVIWAVPTVKKIDSDRVSFLKILSHKELLRLNYGVFVLHLTQTALFVVIPASLIQNNGWPVAEHWKIYLSVLLISFAVLVPIIIVGERKKIMPMIFAAAVALLAVTQFSLGIWLNHPYIIVFVLLLFFIAFNILEASQPALVSKIAPAGSKGTALGIYNTLQALGLFCGGLMSGWIKQHVNASSVFFVTAALIFVWFLIAATMINLPQTSSTAAS